MKYLTLKNPIKAIQYRENGDNITAILNFLGLDSTLFEITKTGSGDLILNGTSVDDGDWLCNADGFLDVINDSDIQRDFSVADNWDSGGFW